MKNNYLEKNKTKKIIHILSVTDEGCNTKMICKIQFIFFFFFDKFAFKEQLFLLVKNQLLDYG